MDGKNFRADKKLGISERNLTVWGVNIKKSIM
jgi:hypothetical protein